MTPPVFLTQSHIVATAAPNLSIAPILSVNENDYIVPIGGMVKVPRTFPATVNYTYRDGVNVSPAPLYFDCAVDIDGDGSCGTDADINAWFDAYAASDDGLPCTADWNEDGIVDWHDIAAFFSSLAGGG